MAGARKISIVGNTVDIHHFFSYEHENVLDKSFDNYFKIMYIGSFSKERGLETAIRALSFLQDSLPAARLLLIGDGKNKLELQNLARELGVAEQVFFWLGGF